MTYNGKPAKYPDETEAQYLERLRAWAAKNGNAAKEEVRLMIEERQRASKNAEEDRAQRLRKANEEITNSSLGLGISTAFDSTFADTSSSSSSDTSSSSSDFSGGGGDFGGGGSSSDY